MSVINNNMLAGAAGQSGGAAAAAGYEIERSLRFNSADSGRLSRTPGTTGNQKTCTFSAWVKRSKLGTVQFLFEARDATGDSPFQFGSDDRVTIAFSDGTYAITTEQVFRDTSSWYHFVLAFDTTQKTPSERVRFYVNGDQVTAFSSASYPPENHIFAAWNKANKTHNISNYTSGGPRLFMDAYLADVQFIDGLALSPIFFGEYDDNGVWQPKAFDNGAATANDGTTWSSDVTTNGGTSWFGGAAANVFDGNAGTFVSGALGGDVTFTPTTAIPVTTQLRIWADSGSGFGVGNGPYQISYNGTQIYNGVMWNSPFTISVAPGTSLSSLVIDQTGTGEAMRLFAIEVDGIILKNNTTTTIEYGTNGFHLDFADNSSNAALGYDAAGSNDWDVYNINAASGTVWSDYVTGTAYSSIYLATEAFDGNANTANMSLAAGGATMTFTPPSAIPVTSSLRIWGNKVGSGGDLTINGTSIASQMAANSYQWNTITGFSSITSIAWSSQDGNNAFLVAAIEVDGTILVDGAPAEDVDSLRDSPTNGDTANDTGLGGEVPGNYCTLNPLHKYGTLSFSNGNLDVSASASGFWVLGTVGVSTGKWYWEGQLTSGSAVHFGISESSFDNYSGQRPMQTASGYAYLSDGRTYHNGTLATYGASYTTGDVIGIALDMDAGTLVFYKNGTSQGTAFTGLSGTFTYCFSDTGSTGGAIHNFGQRAFAYQNVGVNRPSADFKPLCTAFLPDPDIADGSTAMDVLLYTGTGSQQTISGLNFEPDLVWTKGRSIAELHLMSDRVRGVPGNLYPNLTNAEDSNSYLSALTTDGFTVQSAGIVNSNGSTYAAWCWDAGTSTVSNTDGSITSQVRANTTAGFSIVSWSGVASSVQTVGHGLGVAPTFMILKFRQNSNWSVYHSSIGNTGRLSLNTSGGTSTSSTYWNNTSPTSTVFTIGPDLQGSTVITYCFTPIEGYSAFGSYEGNGSADGPFVYTGFRPRWIMYKWADGGGEWAIRDTARSPYNVSDEVLTADGSGTEQENAVWNVDILSNGFKIRTSSAGSNSSSTFVYAAFAENPFKYARAR